MKPRKFQKLLSSCLLACGMKVLLYVHTNSGMSERDPRTKRLVGQAGGTKSTHTTRHDGGDEKRASRPDIFLQREFEDLGISCSRPGGWMGRMEHQDLNLGRGSYFWSKMSSCASRFWYSVRVYHAGSWRLGTELSSCDRWGHRKVGRHLSDLGDFPSFDVRPGRLETHASGHGSNLQSGWIGQVGRRRCKAV
jgi:hypothetical protein